MFELINIRFIIFESLLLFKAGVLVLKIVHCFATFCGCLFLWLFWSGGGFFYILEGCLCFSRFLNWCGFFDFDLVGCCLIDI